MSDKQNTCKLCDKKTNVVYNINFKAVPVCESCARAITLQEITDLIHKVSDKPTEGN